MDVLECIRTRRSSRSYNNRKIEQKIIKTIIESAIWAPSAKNMQPWSFCVIQDENLINDISKLSIYEGWMKKSTCYIIVFLDKNQNDTYIKDVQAIGATIQNILLTAHSLGIAACWVGEILKQERIIKDKIGIEKDAFELMAIISLGYSDIIETVPKRISLESKIIVWK